MMLLGLIYMHAHTFTHLHTVCTHRDTNTEKENEQVLLFRKMPMRSQSGTRGSR